MSSQLSTILSLAILVGQLSAQGSASVNKTRLVLLGTGGPMPDPDRSGPATAIVVNGSAYLVDFGAGVVRRAAAAALDRGVQALVPTNLKVAFLTHMHSDHTVGYADLIFTPRVFGRGELTVYGPKGIKEMSEHILAAYAEDVRIRSREEGGGAGPPAPKITAHEVRPGVIFKDANVTVTAFRTAHGDIESYGYRFQTPDRRIVISGDTGPSEATIEACDGCDILVHEALSLDFLAKSPRFAPYAAKHHTTTAQLSELATKARPRLLVLYHNSIVLRPAVNPVASAPEELLKEVQDRYKGHVVIGRDLDVY